MKLIYFLGIAACALALSSVGCSQRETTRARKDTGHAVNEVVDATRGALKQVSEGINNAVYK